MGEAVDRAYLTHPAGYGKGKKGASQTGGPVCRTAPCGAAAGACGGR